MVTQIAGQSRRALCEGIAENRARPDIRARVFVLARFVEIFLRWIGWISHAQTPTHGEYFVRGKIRQPACQNPPAEREGYDQFLHTSQSLRSAGKIGKLGFLGIVFREYQL